MSEVEPIALAIIVREGKVLVARRAPGRRLAGLWEFPGGRIEPGETALEAAERECREEIGLTVRARTLVCVHRHRYADVQVELHAVLCEMEEGEEPRPLSADKLDWISLEELETRPIPEANYALMEVLGAELAGKMGSAAS